jgi:PAS domain S-box-containing protein
LIVALFFVLEFVSLVLASRSFFNGLNELYELNRANESMRQAREAVVVLRDTIVKGDFRTLDAEARQTILATSREADLLITQARDSRRKTWPEAKFTTAAWKSFDDFRWLINHGSAEDAETQLLLARQYLIETVDALSKAQIQASGDANRVFNELSRNRFRPMTVGAILAIIFVSLILLIGFTMTKQIHHSIQQLIDATKLVGSGNFSFAPHAAGADEINVLAQAFRQMTESLRDTTVSRDFVVDVIDSMRDTVIFLDIDGFIRGGNRRIFETLGYTLDEISGKTLVMFFPDGLSFHGDIRDHEAQIETKGRKKIPVAVSISPIGDKKQQTTGYVVVIADITERKRNEEAIHARNVALANANRELEAFSYSVSHDLRSPLRALDGFSHALLEDYGEKLEPDAKRYLDRIRTASQTMGKLIDDLLNLSRLSRAEMKLASVDLSQISHDILNALMEHETQRHVEIKIQDGIVANADPSLIRVVLTNLLENAWKYTSKKERAVIEFGETSKDGHRVFFVKDNGAGFNMEYSKKLFGAFQRLHTASEFPGTGVGLATVLRIIRRHGGNAWALGEVGKGATFYFTLT